MVVDERERVAPSERRHAGGKFVERGAEFIKVGSLVNRLCRSAGELRRDVGQRTGDVASMAGLVHLLSCKHGETEVGQFRRQVSATVQDIGRREVEMEHAAPVHAGKAACNLPRQVNERRRVHRRGRSKRLPAIVAEHQHCAGTTGQQLRHTRKAGEVPQQAGFMTLPRKGVRPEQLLADDRGAAQHPPYAADSCAPAAVEYFGSCHLVGNHRVAPLVPHRRRASEPASMHAAPTCRGEI